MPLNKEVTEKETRDLPELLDQYKLDISNDADITEEQREQANEDMVFIHRPGGMWEGFFENTLNPAVERIKMQFDLTSEYRDRFIGNWEQNRAAVEFKSDDAATTDEDTDLMNGIHRTDYQDFSGELSIDNAVQEVADCGIGAFKIATKFEDDEDPENDFQRIEFRPIPNAYNSVFWDSNAKWINKRDAMHCTELTEFDRESFLRAYPGKDPVSAYVPRRYLEPGLRINRRADEIYIATRYSIIREKVTVHIYNNLQTDEVNVFSDEEHKLIEDELKTDEFRVFVRKRRIIKQSVERSVFSGTEFLDEPERIAGRWIPIIPMYGFRGYVDGVEWYRGLVRPLKDANRAFNMQISQIMEHAAAGNQNKPIFDPDQVEGEVGKTWANLVNAPYALANALRHEDGTIAVPGPLGYTQSAQLDANTAALMQVIPEFIRSTTGGAPQDTLDPNASGKAIQAMIKRENLKTLPMLKNIVKSIVWGGDVYASIAEEVYSSRRIVTITGNDGSESKKQLFEQVMDEDTGKLVEANNIKGKKFKVFADIGPAHESQKEATVEENKAMIEAIAKVSGGEIYLNALIASMIENSSGTNLGPLKKIARTQNIIAGITKPENEEEEQILAQARAPKEDPNAALLAAAATQQEAEARNLDAKSLDNTASAEKKAAETRKIIIETETGQIKTLFDIRKDIFDRTNALPI